MTRNNRRGVSRSKLVGQALILLSWGCGSAQPEGATPGGAAAVVSDGSESEGVREVPSATDARTESSGATSMVGATDTGGSSPESVDGAAFDGVGGPSGPVGGSAPDADGSAKPSDSETGAEGEAGAEGEMGGQGVAEPPACAIAHPGGVVNQQLTSGGREREYRLFVPNSYDGQTRLPLMLNLHGSGGTAAGQAEDSGMERLAQEEGFIVIGLQGLENRWNVPMNPNDVDDVQYTSDVLDDALQRVCVNERKVYATGFSGGARMSSRLACNLSERIAAIAPVSGIRWPAPCNGRAVPVVTFHGLADPQNTYAGMARADEWVESVEDALEGWAAHNGCAAARRETPEVNLVSVYSYGDCTEQADVVLYRIAGLGHTWAKNEIDATREMWSFLKERALP